MYFVSLHNSDYVTVITLPVLISIPGPIKLHFPLEEVAFFSCLFCSLTLNHQIKPIFLVHLVLSWFTSNQWHSNPDGKQLISDLGEETQGITSNDMKEFLLHPSLWGFERPLAPIYPYLNISKQFSTKQGFPLIEIPLRQCFESPGLSTHPHYHACGVTIPIWRWELWKSLFTTISRLGNWGQTIWWVLVPLVSKPRSGQFTLNPTEIGRIMTLCKLGALTKSHDHPTIWWLLVS